MAWQASAPGAVKAVPSANQSWGRRGRAVWAGVGWGSGVKGV